MSEGKAKLIFKTASAGSEPPAVGKARLYDNGEARSKRKRVKSIISSTNHYAQTSEHNVRANEVQAPTTFDEEAALLHVDVGLTGTGGSSSLDGAVQCIVNTGASESSVTASEYWQALDALEVLFRISEYDYAFQDWDEQALSLRIGIYYHLTALPKGPSEVGVYCSCPQAKMSNKCLHREVFFTHIEDCTSLPLHAPVPTPPAVLLHITPFHDQYIFSCLSSVGLYESGKRTIVALQRNGQWHCQSCRFSDACKHRPHAKAFALAAGFVTTAQDPTPVAGYEAEDLENELLFRAVGCRTYDGKNEGVSYLPISPPRWCSFPNEPSYSAAKPSFHHMLLSNSVFPLNQAARCSCGILLPSQFTATISATVIFDVHNRFNTSIQLSPCPQCHHSRRQIGPDLREYGLFNWNNSMLFSHDLLNTYTNMYTASETPFSAFCLTIRRSYKEHDINVMFCSDETFVRAWFAFIQLQEINSGMCCPTCGPMPDIVIADGISLGTHKSKLTKWVLPPTKTNTSSERIDSISTYKARGLPAIVKPEMRTILKKVLERSPLERSSTNVSDLTALQPQDDESFSEMVLKLEPKLPELYRFVIFYLQINPLSSYYKIYRTLLQQIAAPDIVLQLVPYRAIQVLRDLDNTGVAPDWLQSIFPAFGALVNIHRHIKTPVPDAVRRLAGWLASRSFTVYSQLAQHDPAPVSQNLETDTGALAWKQTGTYYGVPAVRKRRIYEKIRNDGSTMDLQDTDSRIGDSECNKFYKTYAKNNLTGGILVLWCRHSICLGFHSIPVAEGRNDVFSAIYTRFPKAPKVIVYDFACQLATYCLVREARFFRDTRFLIDEMHAHDHTRCGQACFASNWMRFDDEIRAANTSAAECGNQGMHRIRKSVSFMAYSHAILFIKTFLDVWNRTTRQRMSKV